MSRYNLNPNFRQEVVEIGVVLFADRGSGELRPEPDVRGPHGSQVAPYAGNGLLRVLESCQGEADLYLGDYHSHVGSGLSWTDHVPSPEDLTRESCLCDMWPAPGLGLNASVPVSPTFQLIQANLFGDIFLVTRTPTRTAFATLPAQAAAMSAIEHNYGIWHLQALHKHGGLQGLTFPIRHTEFVASIREELPNMNATLGGRGRITFIENKNYKSDDPDFLE